MSFWPEGFQSAAVITINFDGESHEQPLLPGEPLWGRYSFGRYGAQVGILRILEVLDRFGIRATFFIPAWDVERYPNVMDVIAKGGHELAGRGYANEDFSKLPPDEQRSTLEKSEAVFERAFGQRPVGWRAPSGAIEPRDPQSFLGLRGSLMSAETRSILGERGYKYDSSYCDDDLPYVVPAGDGQQLVELPQFHTASDRPYYEHHRQPWVVADAWREELSAVHEVSGLFNLAIHPRGDWGSGRGVRIRPIEAIFQALCETPNIWMTTCDEVADWALETNKSRNNDVRSA